MNLDDVLRAAQTADEKPKRDRVWYVRCTDEENEVLEAALLALAGRGIEMAAAAFVRTLTLAVAQEILQEEERRTHGA